MRLNSTPWQKGSQGDSEEAPGQGGRCQKIWGSHITSLEDIIWKGVKFHSISILAKDSMSGFKFNFPDCQQLTRPRNHLLLLPLPLQLTPQSSRPWHSAVSIKMGGLAREITRGCWLLSGVCHSHPLFSTSLRFKRESTRPKEDALSKGATLTVKAWTCNPCSFADGWDAASKGTGLVQARGAGRDPASTLPGKQEAGDSFQDTRTCPGNTTSSF